MKRSLAIKLLAFTMLAAASPARADFLFQATLTHDQEVITPGIPNEGSSGIATFLLNDARTTLTYDVRLFGLDLRGVSATGVPGQTIPGEPVGSPARNDNLTRLHIHRQFLGVNGNIVFGMIDANPNQRNDADDLVIDIPGLHVTGVWDLNEGSRQPGQQTTLAAELGNLFADGLYINVHTEDHGGGEIRGQILG